MVPGNKIFFVEDGLIRGYGIIFGVRGLSEPALCDVTDREWGQVGGFVVEYHNWHWLKSPVPMEGFQGIRYLDRLPELKNTLLDSEAYP